jgi:hypothetical protein
VPRYQSVPNGLSLREATGLYLLSLARCGRGSNFRLGARLLVHPANVVGHDLYQLLDGLYRAVAFGANRCEFCRKFCHFGGIRCQFVTFFALNCGICGVNL